MVGNNILGLAERIRNMPSNYKSTFKLMAKLD
jgi:hypothetical protein